MQNVPTTLSECTERAVDALNDLGQVFQLTVENIGSILSTMGPSSGTELVADLEYMVSNRKAFMLYLKFLHDIAGNDTSIACKREGHLRAVIRCRATGYYPEWPN